MTKPKAVYFEGSNEGIHERMRIAYLLPFRQLIAKDFDLRIVEGDADFAKEVESHKADIAIFSSGIETDKNVRAPLIENLSSHSRVPRIGLMLNDLYGISRLRGFRHLESCGCEAYFGVYNFAQNGIPELADRFFMIPFWLNADLFKDYGHEKVIPLGLYGAGFADSKLHYPWRTQITRQVLNHFPCFLSGRPDGLNQNSLVGSAFAEQLNRTKIAFACGSINRSFTRKHLETCGTRTALFCEQIPILEALGFRDGDNCVFVNEKNVREKVADYLADEPKLEQLAQRGYEFVRSQHALESRRQLIEWYLLRQSSHTSKMRIGQPDIKRPLELVDVSLPGSKINWDVRNPMDRLIDHAYQMFWSSNVKSALEVFQQVTKGMPGHIEARTGEILCLMASGNASLAMKQIRQMRQFLLEYFGCDHNEEVLEALLAFCLILENPTLDVVAEQVNLPDKGHPLVKMIRKLLRKGKLRPEPTSSSRESSFVTLQYRTKASPDEWWQFLETVCRTSEKTALWGQLTDETSYGGQTQLDYQNASEPMTPEHLELRLRAVGSAPEAWIVAQEAVRAGAEDIAFAASHTAASYDRNFAPAYLLMGQRLAQQGKYEEAYLCFKEASRVGDISAESAQLLTAMEASPELRNEALRIYQSRIGVGPVEAAKVPRKILVFTNLLPPQEMGGFGRSVWELCDGLIQRGHQLCILTADVKNLEQTPYPDYERVERFVDRSLQLFGNWDDGAAIGLEDRKQIEAIALHNVKVILSAVEKFKPEVCMAGNLDFLSGAMLGPILAQKIPIVHRLGNESPGYPVEQTPQSNLYCIAGCSHWVNAQLTKAGYLAGEFACLPPGSPLHEYYRLTMPRTDRLRICFAGLMMAYKGPHLILQALQILKKLQIPFTCEFAGDFKNAKYEGQFKQWIRQFNLTRDVRLLGFCGRRELGAMYARSNVLVMPSIFEEPFGKVQIEAQAAGLAVVRTPVGGYEDMITDEVNGLLFKREDPEDLARQLYVLSQDSALWQKIAQQGQADAFRYTSSASVRILEDLFENLQQAAFNSGK